MAIIVLPAPVFNYKIIEFLYLNVYYESFFFYKKQFFNFLIIIY